MTPIPHRPAFQIMSPRPRFLGGRPRVRFGWAYALRRAVFAVAKLGLQIGLIMALIGALACFMSFTYQAGWDGMGARLAAIAPESKS
jgi:hypothetical protein